MKNTNDKDNLERLKQTANAISDLTESDKKLILIRIGLYSVLAKYRYFAYWLIFVGVWAIPTSTVTRTIVNSAYPLGIFVAILFITGMVWSVHDKPWRPLKQLLEISG